MSKNSISEATTEEVDVLSNTSKLPASDKKSSKKIPNPKRKKKIKKTITYILIALAAILLILWKTGVLGGIFSDGNRVSSEQLSVYSVSTRTITKTLTSSGTIEPNDSYTITALVSGDILNDYFEEGDTVQEDQLLYEIDSSNLDSSVKRAQNALKKAITSLDDAYESLEKLDVKSKYTGTVEKLYVEIGDDVNSGTVIADIVDKDTMCIDVPFMSTDVANIRVGDNALLTFDSYETLNGAVTEVGSTTSVSSLGVVTRNVTISVKNTGSITPNTFAYASVGEYVCTDGSNFYYNDEGKITAEISGEVKNIYLDEGDRIYKNQTLLKLESSSLENQIESLELSVDDAQSSLDDALDAYDNYNITSPISGTVISKDYKAGDTLGNGSNSGGSSMAVIYDMSAFKFEMSIDELDIDSLEIGQDVLITSDARKGKEYHGEITNISIQGVTSNGTTVYPVTVTIDNVEDESLRTTDEDGAVHKTYKTGKTSVTNKYSLIDKTETDDGFIYNYDNDISIKAVIDENGEYTYYDESSKVFTKLSENTYSIGSDTYTFSDGMSTLSIEITDESKMLKPGMNIDADIVVEKAENVISVPVSAVLRGYTVKVVKHADESEQSKANSSELSDAPTENNEYNNRQPGDMPDLPESAKDNTSGKGEMNVSNNSDTNGNDSDGRMSENTGVSNRRTSTATDINNMTPGEYGTVATDTAYDEVKVEIGINDADFVEITSGLSVGDVVILDEKNAMGIGSTSTTQQMSGFGGGFPGGMSGMGGGGAPGGGFGGGMR